MDGRVVTSVGCGFRIAGTGGTAVAVLIVVAHRKQ